MIKVNSHLDGNFRVNMCIWQWIQHWRCLKWFYTSFCQWSCASIKWNPGKITSDNAAWCLPNFSTEKSISGIICYIWDVRKKKLAVLSNIINSLYFTTLKIVFGLKSTSKYSVYAGWSPHKNVLRKSSNPQQTISFISIYKLYL